MESIHESFRLTQCYHCLAFDHIKSNCPHTDKPRLCARCGSGEHATTDCTNDASCLHCEGPHSTTARCCPVYLQTFASKCDELLQRIKNQLVPNNIELNSTSVEHNNTEPNHTPIESPESLPDSWLLLSAAVNASVHATNSPEDFLSSLYTMLKNKPSPPKKINSSNSRCL